MSLFSKIGKGLKKLTLKKVLKVAAPVAALAIPGVGPVVAGAIAGVGRVAARGAVAAGQIIAGAGGAARDVAGAVGGLAEGAAEEAGQTLDTVGNTRDTVERNAARIGMQWDAFRGGGLSGTLNNLSKSLPTILLVGGGLVLVFVLLNRRK